MRKRHPKPEGVTWVIRQPKRKNSATEGTNRPNPLKALAKLSREAPTLLENVKLEEEINLEKNDRGVAVLISTNVENILQSAIEKRLTIHDGEFESLFGFDSPIGTFENKIRIGYALDIFGKQTRLNLLYIKAVRNAFAHAQKPMTFETPEVKAVCDLLVVPELVRTNSLSAWHIELMKGYALSTRQRFINICNALAFNLFCYYTYAIQLPAIEPLSDPNFQILARPISLL